MEITDFSSEVRNEEKTIVETEQIVAPPVAEMPVFADSAKPKKKLNIARLIAVLGVIAGIVVIILGSKIYSGKFGDDGKKYQPKSDSFSEIVYTNYEYYGGDAYTGIQQAGADASRNAAAAAENIEEISKGLVAINDNINVMNDNINENSEASSTATGMLIIALGIFMIFYFAGKAFEGRTSK